GGGVGDVQPLRAAALVPVDQVQGGGVLLAVGEVDVDGEAGERVPGGGDAVVGGADLLQAAHVAGGGHPGAAGGAAGADLGVGRVVGGVADDVVAVAAVGPLPVALRARVRPHERRGGRKQFAPFQLFKRRAPKTDA